ncbi:MAG: AsmA family protein [Muribaculaceae bacterium]|nr:AsmA family protein [Muribaculaceae bacterium]
MKTNSDYRHISESHPDAGKPRHRSALRIIGYTLGGIALFIILLLCGISLFLTPARLTRIVNREASEYLNADINAHHIDYTIWSSFPRFHVYTDSIEVISRTLKSVSPEIRKLLPADADSLASLRSFSGSINIIDLFLNRYVIHDVKVDGLSLNLVAYNDSINNYNIIPSTSDNTKRIPYISAHLIDLKNPGQLKYYSKASNTSASLDLKEFCLTRKEKKERENLYDLSISGKVNASSAGLTILKGFPFSLSGDLQLRFDPFGVQLIDYGINLGEIKSKLSMSVGIGDDPKLESFDYRISSINLMNLIGYIPKEFMPSLQGIRSDMNIRASARLMSAWRFSSDVFPSIKIDFSTPAGTLDYEVAADNSSNTASGQLHTYPLSYSPITGIFFFNGEHPDKSYVDIPRFSVATDGVEVAVSAKVVDLTTSPLITAAVDIQSDLKKTLRNVMGLLPSSIPMNLSGNLHLLSDLRFNIESFSKEGIEKGLYNIEANGALTVDDTRLTIPSSGVDVSLNNLSVDFSQSLAALTPECITAPTTDVRLRIDRAAGKANTGTFNATGLNLSSSLHSSASYTPQQLQAGLPIKVGLGIEKMSYRDIADRFAIAVSNTRLNDTLTSAGSKTLKNFLSDGLRLQSRRIDIREARNRFVIHRPALTLSISERVINAKTHTSPQIAAAPEISKLPAHTPMLLSAEIPAGLRTFLSQFSFLSTLDAQRIDLLTPGADKDNHLADVRLALNEDKFSILNASMMLEKTGAHLKGDISNIRNFLMLPASEENPLDVDMEMQLDTVNINTLAHTYAMAKGGVDKIKPHTEVRSSDSIAVVIPRNIRAHINAKAKETIYMNLHLYDLRTNINVLNGIADIPALDISTGFGDASMNLRYDTSRLDSLNFGIGANLDNVNITNFFKNFHGLLEMMPEMKNLTGMLSVGIDGKGQIFPDMYLNMPSVSASLDVTGWNLKVHQSKFIRKITRMMLIESGDDIHIKDMKVNAGIHDNLLQLNPFDFEFDKYKLHLLGINNFNGKLYYHIAVMQSPIPFPFAINIEGMFHDPKLRFGGPKYNLKRAEEVTSQIEENNNINLVSVARSFMGAFIHKAAEAAEDPNLSL